VQAKNKIVIAALAALAIGGIGTGTALASGISAAPGSVAVQPAALQVAAPEAEAPDAAEAPGAPETDNIQHEATGDEGNHADEPAGTPGK
jgi:hypothetical protein